MSPMIIKVNLHCTGDSHVSISASFRISPSAVGKIILETCDEALWKVLVDNDYLQPLTSECDWKRIARDFESKWNFPNCIGAIDGKHVVLQAPARSDSSFFNYKKSHSIVLMAICDSNYSFRLVYIGDAGRNSDGGVFANIKMGHDITNKLLNIPESEVIKFSNKLFPYVFVGDEAFQLTDSLMKPFPRAVLSLKERVFNYRLSRARRVIENTFGIDAARFIP